MICHHYLRLMVFSFLVVSRYTGLIAVLLFFSFCAQLNAKPSLCSKTDYDISRELMENGDIRGALSALPEKKNSFISVMEKTYLELCSGGNDIGELQKYASTIDNQVRFKVSRSLKSSFYLETPEEYYASEHEIIWMHFLLAWGYCKKKDFENAQVEAKKASYLIQGKWSDEGAFDDPFLRIMMGTIWTMCGNWDEARVDFRKAAELDSSLQWCSELSAMENTPPRMYVVLSGSGYEPVWNTANNNIQFHSVSNRSPLVISNGNSAKPMYASPDSIPCYYRHINRDNLYNDIIDNLKRMSIRRAEYYQYVRFLPERLYISWLDNTSGKSVTFADKLGKDVKLFPISNEDSNSIQLFWFSDNAFKSALLKNETRPLVLLARKGEFVAAEYVLLSGAKANSVDYKGISVLEWAIINGNTHLAMLLLEFGANPWYNGEREGGALTEAVIRQNYTIAEAILRRSKKEVEKVPDRRSKMYLKNNLYRGCIGTKLDNIGYIGTKLDCVTYKGDHLLYYSVTAKNQPMTELLLRYGASVEFHCSNSDVRYLLTHALRNSSIEIFKMIFSRVTDNYVKENALWFAVIDQNVEIVKFLLQNGVDVHQDHNCYRKNDPLLCLAVKKEHYSADIIKLLFGHSSEEEIHEAFTYILDRRDPELIDIFIECGFDINTDKDALCVAVKDGNDITAEALINKGFNVNTYEGSLSPLYYAVCWQNIRIMELLLKKGADPALPMGNGKSVLESMDEIRTFWNGQIPPEFPVRRDYRRKNIKKEKIKIITDMLAVSPK